MRSRISQMKKCDRKTKSDWLRWSLLFREKKGLCYSQFVLKEQRTEAKMKLILPFMGWQVSQVPTPCPGGTWHACMQSWWDNAISRQRHFLCWLYQMKRSQHVAKMPFLHNGTHVNILPEWRKENGGWGNVHLCGMTSETSLRSTDLTPVQVIIHKRAEMWSPREQHRGGHSSCTRLPPQIESSALKRVVEQEKKKIIWDSLASGSRQMAGKVAS